MLLDRAGLGDEVGVDSAGTAAYHEGDPPDPRSVAVAEDRGGFTLDGRARRVTPADFEHFDWIFAMDPENLRELEMLKRRHHRKGRLCLLRMFDPEADPDDLTVPDPYYGGPKGFDLIYDQIQRSCEAFIQQELR